MIIKRRAVFVLLITNYNKGSFIIWWLKQRHNVQ